MDTCKPAKIANIPMYIHTCVMLPASMPLSIKDAIVVSLIRVVVVSTLFGTSLTLAYSLSGAVLSLLIMVLLKKSDRFSIVGVSVAGGISHNIGQIIMAIILMHNSVISYYLPFLIISGIVTGVVIGLVSAKIVERVKI